MRFLVPEDPIYSLGIQVSKNFEPATEQLRTVQGML